MWASEAMCSFIFSKAFLQRFNPTVFQFVWLLYFSIFKKRRQLKQNMASVLGDYSSRRLLYHLFWNDHPSTFFGNDSTGWQGPILSHIRIKASLYFKLNCRTCPGSVGCCSSSRFKEQPLSGFGICILYSVSCFAVLCAVSFVCASTFPLSLHPLSPGSLFPELFLSRVPQHFPLPLHPLSPGLLFPELFLSRVPQHFLFLSILCLLARCSLNCFCHMCLNISLFLSILCLLACCSLNCFCHMCLNISLFLSILCLLSCCSLRCIFCVCLNISSFSPSSVSWLAVPCNVSFVCASTFPSSSPSSVSWLAVPWTVSVTCASTFPSSSPSSVSWLAVPWTVSVTCASTFPSSSPSSVSCLAVPCAVSFVCASTFPLPLHPLSPSPHLIYYFPLSVHLGTRLNLHKMYSQILKSMFK